MPLLWRIFLGNALILVAGTAALVVSPATVSFPVATQQLVVLCVGLGVMLGLNYALLRYAVGPLRQLTAVMREVDPLSPGRRSELPVATGEVSALARAFDQMLDRLERERRDSAHRTVTAQEQERQRIARELHDEVGQGLTGILLLLERAEARAEGEAEERVREAREGVRETLQRVRVIAQNLRPEALDDLGLAAALRQLSRQAERAGLVVNRQIASNLHLGPDAELVVYRVAQEAITNALRHAGAKAISIELDGAGTRAVLRVSDDGRGREGAAEGAGIRGMRERAVLVGATLEVSATRAGGTLVTLTIE